MIIRTLLQAPARKWLQIIFGTIITLLGLYIFLTHIGQARAYYVTVIRTLWDPYLRISYFLEILGVYLILQALPVSSKRRSTFSEGQEDVIAYGISATLVFRWLTKLSALWVIALSSLMFCLSPIDLDLGQILQVALFYGVLLYAGHTLRHFSTTPPEKRKRALIVFVALLWLEFIGLPIINAALDISSQGLGLSSFFFAVLFTLPFILLSYFVVNREAIAKICDTIFLFILTFLLPPLTFVFAVGAFVSNFR